jgi:hypothetical protein
LQPKKVGFLDNCHGSEVGFITAINMPIDKSATTMVRRRNLRMRFRKNTRKDSEDQHQKKKVSESAHNKPSYFF